VFAFHGWCENASMQASEDGLRDKLRHSAIVVHPEGYSDPTDCGDTSCHKWQSFNGAGSAGVESGGTDGPICNDSVVKDGQWQLYKSCMDLGYGGDRCRWSHCLSDVNFTLAMIEDISSITNIDKARVYGTGDSNGAMFLYELARDARSSHIFSAIAPVSGLPHNGFNYAPTSSTIRFLEIQGSRDLYVQPYAGYDPLRPDKSYSSKYGWYFSAWDNTTNLWATAKGYNISGRTTLQNAVSGYTCSGWGQDIVETAEIATCFYAGGHQKVPGNAYTLVLTFFGL